MCPVQEIINSTVVIFIVKLHFHISMRDALTGYKPSKAFLFVDNIAFGADAMKLTTLDENTLSW